MMFSDPLHIHGRTKHNMNGASTVIFFLILNIPKIPSIKKFKGDNEVSFNKQTLQFETQSGALGVENNKKRQVLLCCLKDSAFTLASQRINAENDITYYNLKAALVETFSGEDYNEPLKQS